MEVLRSILLIYCFVGIFVAGGLFFSKKKLGSTFLSFYILVLILDQLNFLYETSGLLQLYPEYFLWVYPVCLIFGPLLWWHFIAVKNEKTSFSWKQAIHLLPFVLTVLVGLIPVYLLPGTDRVLFARDNFMSYLMPINYIRTTHAVIYGIVMVYYVKKESLFKQGERGRYLTVITIVYFTTACLQSYLTAFAESYTHFVVFYVLASTTILISGIILFGYPQILEGIQKKYFGTQLSAGDKNRILHKLKKLQKDQAFFLNRALNLKILSKELDEKSHHISQVLSEEMDSSFANYVNERRIAFAKALLTHPKNKRTKILAIAFDSGFNNTVTFNKAFVNITGTTPGKYRSEKNRKSN